MTELLQLAAVGVLLVVGALSIWATHTADQTRDSVREMRRSLAASFCTPSHRSRACRMIWRRMASM